MVELIERGSVWVMRFNPNRGSEFGKTRPAIVLQITTLNARLTTTIAVPLTTQFRSEKAALRVAIAARDRLLVPSYAAIEQARVVDRARIGEGPLAQLTDDEMAEVEHKLKDVLGMG